MADALALNAHTLSDRFFTIPQEPRQRPRATERMLNDIYTAARKGLKNDAIATLAGIPATDFNRLKQVDPLVEKAIAQGRADGEAEMADILTHAARLGDAKAALDVLKHVHGWQAAQQVNVSVQGQISITQALQLAEQRVIDGVFNYVDEPARITEAEPEGDE